MGPPFENSVRLIADIGRQLTPRQRTAVNQKRAATHIGAGGLVGAISSWLGVRKVERREARLGQGFAVTQL